MQSRWTIMGLPLLQESQNSQSWYFPTNSHASHTIQTTAQHNIWERTHMPTFRFARTSHRTSVLQIAGRGDTTGTRVGLLEKTKVALAIWTGPITKTLRRIILQGTDRIDWPERLRHGGQLSCIQCNLCSGHSRLGSWRGWRDQNYIKCTRQSITNCYSYTFHPKQRWFPICYLELPLAEQTWTRTWRERNCEIQKKS